MSQLYLAHHGILGQKWGVRRYQNFDGSYTRSGLKRYNESKSTYDSKRANLKSLKEKGADKTSIKRAKGDVKIAKRRMDKDYKHLKLDKMADKGKERYQSGQTISNRNRTLNDIASASGTIGLGAQFLGRAGLLDQKTANIVTAGTWVASGAAYIGGRFAEKGNKELRAYYTHTSRY